MIYWYSAGVVGFADEQPESMRVLVNKEPVEWRITLGCLEIDRPITKNGVLTIVNCEFKKLDWNKELREHKVTHEFLYTLHKNTEKPIHEKR